MLKLRINRKMPPWSDRRKALRRGARSGIATLEVVIATGIMIPALCFAAYAGFQACRLLYCLVSSMVGSAYM